MVETILVRGTLCVVTECGSCGVVYTIPKRVYDFHWQEGGFHYCPNGHTWGWAKEGCERERLRRDRDRLAQRIAEKDDQIAELAREREAAEVRTARLRRRVEHGVCPDCNRSFANLRRHMVTKHGPKCEVVALKAAANAD
jgi:hypothetical protein